MSIDSARAKSLFLTASDLADPVKRAAFLDQECGADAELRARVEALLKANDAMPLSTPNSAVPTLGGAPSGPIGPESILTAEYRNRLESGIVVSNRYILQEKIGEGGMGEVWVAKQTEPVKRRVALKLIKPGMDSRTVLARFEQERQALALMDHPNIARVLDAGLTPTGQPFFVMELVNGLALNKFCDELKLTPRERLELFVPICQAVQHAHQKGIVHRDLKPANILITMIDGKPVPKVIDFGVAKATAGKLSDDSIATQFGSVVGTLEYMSPEQAGFSGEDIDTRSDIYSLGVILYEMLTGLKPIDSAKLKKAALTEMIRIIREEDPSRPSTRLSTNESLPSLAALRRTEPKKLMSMLKGELDWVVMKCLEKQRERRYETANGLAREIQRYLADEMVEARPPSTRYRLGKFVRKYPLQLALTGTLSLLVLGGAGVIWWQQEQAGSRREAELRQQLVEEQRAATEVARIARNAEAVTSLLRQCEEALRTGDGKRAGLVLEAAKKRSAEGGAEESGERLSRLESDLALLKGLDEVDQFRWIPLETKLPDSLAVTNRFREVLSRFGMNPETNDVEAMARKVSVSVIRERVIFAWDWLLRHGKNPSTRTALARVDPDPFRDAIRDAVLANDAKAFLDLTAQKKAENQPAGFAAFLGESQVIPLDRRRKFLRNALWEHPGNLSLLMLMGSSFRFEKTNHPEEQLRWYQAAIAAAPDNINAHLNLGIALRDKGQVDQAIICFRKVIELDPNYGFAHNNLGVVLGEKGQVEQAIACFQKAIELHPNDAVAHHNLGFALQKKGQDELAIPFYRKSIELHPNDAVAHNNLGLALKARGQVEQAINCYRKAIEIDPNYAISQINLGNALQEKSLVDPAIACFQKAIELDPKSAMAHHNLGNAIMKKGLVEQAIASYRRAIEIDPNFGMAYNSLGKALLGKDQVELAIDCYRKAIDLYPNDADGHNSLGVALMKKGQVDPAIAYFQKAIELNPKLAIALNNLGKAQRDKGQMELAIACFRRVIEQDPNFALAHINLGNALQEKGQVELAIISYRKAIELNPNDAPAHHSLGVALQKTGQVDKAITCYRKAIELDPKHAKAYHNLGASLQKTGQVDQAITCYRKAIDLNPSEPKAYNNLGIILCDVKKEYDEAILCFRKVLEINPRNASGYQNLVAALAGKGQLDEIREITKKARGLFPENPVFFYNSACLAALEARSKDPLSQNDRARLRNEAREALEGALELFKTILKNPGKETSQALSLLNQMKTDPDLASIRDPEALKNLPPEEQKAFTQLWAEVASTLEKAKNLPK